MELRKLVAFGKTVHVCICKVSDDQNLCFHIQAHFRKLLGRSRKRLQVWSFYRMMMLSKVLHSGLAQDWLRV